MAEYIQKVSVDGTAATTISGTVTGKFGTLQYDGTAGTATGNYSSVQTNTELVAAPGAGVSIYLTDLLISNGATAGYITIVEDTTSAVVKIPRLNLAANGGASIQFATPIKFTAAKNLGITSSTADDFSVTASYFTA